MNKLKENIKDIFTDLLGAVIILASIIMWVRDDIDDTKAGLLFLAGVAFFFIPDDILSQIVQKFVNKKIGDDEKNKQQ